MQNQEMKHCLEGVGGGNRAKLLQVIPGGGVPSNFSFPTFLKKDMYYSHNGK